MYLCADQQYLVTMAGKSFTKNSKTLHTGDLCREQVEALLRESVNMKLFKHPNVMSLIGVCLDMGPVPYIVLPFMPGGDLLTHIQQKQSSLVLDCCEDSEKVCTHLILIHHLDGRKMCCWN